MKITIEITFTNLIGAIGFVVGCGLMVFGIDGGDAIALAGMGLVGTKKIYDMIPESTNAKP